MSILVSLLNLQVADNTPIICYTKDMRVKIIKDHKSYRKGQVVNVSPNEAHGLIDSGYGIVTTDISVEDYHQADTRIKVRRIKET